MRAQFILWTGLVCLQVAVQACRYNVRDLGFMEMPGEGYTFYVCYPRATADAAVTSLTSAVREHLTDSNVAPVFFAEEQAEGVLPAPYRSFPGAFALPAGLLVSPDGPGRVIPLGTGAIGDVSALGRALRAVVASPVRQAILAGASRAFGVILFIEGRQPVANRAARDAIQKAIELIGAEMSALPKTVAEPPVLVELEQGALERESLMLWALGLNSGVVDYPRAAVLYGKGKWIGPLMEGGEISAENLTRLFWIIGADCECGMDLAWTRGTALPLRWDESLQTLSVESVGFDPASPMFQMEAGRVLSRFSYRKPGPLGGEVSEVEAEITVAAVPVSDSAGAERARSGESAALSERKGSSARGSAHDLQSVEQTAGNVNPATSARAVPASGAAAGVKYVIPAALFVAAISMAASGWLFWRRRPNR